MHEATFNSLKKTISLIKEIENKKEDVSATIAAAANNASEELKRAYTDDEANNRDTTNRKEAIKSKGKR
ncbi:MAG: hypothetical protein EOM31_12100 [Bacteroidia bacterium]|nr:hypothetical protein [Bacteroidia bacterium]